MKKNDLQEIVILILSIIPFIYLGVIYAELPENLPMHWNAQGEVDRMGSKQELWIIPILLSGLMYVLFKFIPKMDPKGQIKKMGNKYRHLRMALTVFMTALAIGIIYTSSTYEAGDTKSPEWIFMLVGLLFIVIGNYMPAMKPSYFVGIRTPWTLENDQVWRKTHRLGGYLFIITGLIIVVSSFLLSIEWTTYLTLGTTIAITAWAFIYSYTLFNKTTLS